jgi:hypothetical protein
VTYTIRLCRVYLVRSDARWKYSGHVHYGNKLFIIRTETDGDDKVEKKGVWLYVDHENEQEIIHSKGYPMWVLGAVGR